MVTSPWVLVFFYKNLLWKYFTDWIFEIVRLYGRIFKKQNLRLKSFEFICFSMLVVFIIVEMAFFCVHTKTMKISKHKRVFGGFIFVHYFVCISHPYVLLHSLFSKSDMIFESIKYYWDSKNLIFPVFWLYIRKLILCMDSGSIVFFTDFKKEILFMFDHLSVKFIWIYRYSFEYKPKNILS